MKLYDWWKHDKGSYDCYDIDFDFYITIDWLEGNLLEKNYGKFTVELTKKVDFIRKVNDKTLICNWSKLIRDNYSKFKKFTAKEWKKDYADEEAFIFQWIKELHSSVARYIPDEKYYSKLARFVKSLI